MKIKKHNPLERILMSPTLRNWEYTVQLFRIIILNIWFEITNAHLGIRALDLWKEDKEFLELYKEVKGRTSLSSIKLYTLYQLVKDVISLEGDIAELGVYRGGSAKALAKVIEKYNPDKNLLLFDTFEGFPEPDTKQDLFKKGDLSDTSYEEVKDYLNNYKFVSIYKGLFSDTLPTVVEKSYSFVHIDGDLYSSVQECCEYFYPKMVPGGIILFDDYGFLCAPGAKNAVDEYFLNKVESPIWIPTGQAIVIKQLETTNKNKINDLLKATSHRNAN